MKRLLIANLIVGTFISVQANAATQIDNAPHSNPLSLFSTKDMGGNVKRATYGVKWKDGTMTYTNIELVCGENKARDIGYSDDGTGTAWKDRSNDLYNGKKHYDLVKGSIQSNVYRAVCKDATLTSARTENVLPVSNTKSEWVLKTQTDKMTSKVFQYTEIKSLNKVSMAFPYNGGSIGEIAVMQNGNVRFDISKGQVMCRSWDGCVVKVKFDNGPIIELAGVGPDNGQSGHLYLNSTDNHIGGNQASKFINGLKNAKKVMVQFEVFQEGWPVWEFNVAGFNKP